MREPGHVGIRVKSADREAIRRLIAYYERPLSQILRQLMHVEARRIEEKREEKVNAPV